VFWIPTFVGMTEGRMATTGLNRQARRLSYDMEKSPAFTLEFCLTLKALNRYRYPK